jgi:preprotein translocase subunit Sec61beta
MAEGISTPSGMGGLMRFNEEYASKFKITPQTLVVIIAVIIVGITILKIAIK